jgi:hypothetical protein
MSAVIALRRSTSAIQNGGLLTGFTLSLEWNDISPKFQRLYPHFWPCPNGRRNSNGFSHIFDHARISGDTADIARRQSTSEVQNCGLQTGSTLYLWSGMTYRQNSRQNIFRIYMKSWNSHVILLPEVVYSDNSLNRQMSKFLSQLSVTLRETGSRYWHELNSFR